MQKPTAPHTIAFATAKGGVGKSTFTTLFASYLYYDRAHRVVVIDADSPQHSVGALRTSEIGYIQSDAAFGKTFLRSGRTEIYPVVAVPRLGACPAIWPPSFERRNWYRASSAAELSSAATSAALDPVPTTRRVA